MGPPSIYRVMEEYRDLNVFKIKISFSNPYSLLVSTAIPVRNLPMSSFNTKSFFNNPRQVSLSNNSFDLSFEKLNSKFSNASNILKGFKSFIPYSILYPIDKYRVAAQSRYKPSNVFDLLKKNLTFGGIGTIYRGLYRNSIFYAIADITSLFFFENDSRKNNLNTLLIASTSAGFFSGLISFRFELDRYFPKSLHCFLKNPSKFKNVAQIAPVYLLYHTSFRGLTYSLTSLVFTEKFISFCKGLGIQIPQNLKYPSPLVVIPVFVGVSFVTLPFEIVKNLSFHQILVESKDISTWRVAKLLFEQYGSKAFVRTKLATSVFAVCCMAFVLALSDKGGPDGGLGTDPPPFTPSQDFTSKAAKVEMKAVALLLVRKYEEVMQICEPSLDFADKNSSSSAGSSEGTKNFAARLWRWHLMAKSYFYMGKLEEALSYIEKLGFVTLKFGSKTADLASTLAVTLQELLRHKAAGNEAFQSGRHSEAVKHYTSVLSRNLESRSFAAICFCNRAAAFQALGRIADAIADCSFAIALDPNYPKAISRRATLHDMIRDYSHTAIDLQRLVSLLAIQTDEKSNKSGRLSRSTSGNLDLRQAQTRLYTLEEESRKGIARLWRWHLMAKSYFYMGKLEEALSYLEKLEHAESVTLKFGSKTADSSSTLAVTLRELLRHKAVGNEAFQSGRHSEAVKHYTSVLSCNLESRPFAAICFCNRAAAFQALGRIADAIADCSFAIALDPNYPKAISRRATLHDMIRDYSHTAIDLQRLVSLLAIQTDEKSNKSSWLSRSTSGNLDLRREQTRLYTLEEESRKGIALNFYPILGIESTGVASDIKKAYRKSALRHRPDKAAQVLRRSENGDDWVWKEIADVVYKDADRVFKMIGEAYARFQYDEEDSSSTLAVTLRKLLLHKVCSFSTFFQWRHAATHQAVTLSPVKEKKNIKEHPLC